MLQIDLEKERLCVVDQLGEVGVKVAEAVGSWMTVEEQNWNLRNMEMRGVRVWQSRLKGQQQVKKCSTNGTVQKKKCRRKSSMAKPIHATEASNRRCASIQKWKNDAFSMEHF